MIWSSSHRSTIGSHEYESSPCVEHKSSSLKQLASFSKLESFDSVNVIESTKNLVLPEYHLEIHRNYSARMFADFLPLERTFPRENAISKSDTHGRVMHNRTYALFLWCTCATDNRKTHCTEDRIFYRHSAHFMIVFEISNVFVEYSTDKRSRTRRRFTTQESCAGRLRISRETAKHLHCVNVCAREEVKTNDWKEGHEGKNNKQGKTKKNALVSYSLQYLLRLQLFVIKQEMKKSLRKKHCDKDE